MEERAHLSQSIPGGPTSSRGGGGIPQAAPPDSTAGAADSPRVRAPETARTSPLSESTHRLRRHAGHQAQGEQDPSAPHIPRRPAAPSRRWQGGRNEAYCLAPGAAGAKRSEPEQPQRPRLGLRHWGSRLGGARWLLLRLLPPPAAAPRECGAFSLVGFCTPEAELVLRGGCSLELFLLCGCFTPPRTPSQCRGSVAGFEE